MSVHCFVITGDFWYTSVPVDNGNASFAGVLQTFLGILYAGLDAGHALAVLSASVALKRSSVEMQKPPLRHDEEPWPEPFGNSQYRRFLPEELLMLFRTFRGLRIPDHKKDSVQVTNRPRVTSPQAAVRPPAKSPHKDLQVQLIERFRAESAEQTPRTSGHSCERWHCEKDVAANVCVPAESFTNRAPQRTLAHLNANTVCHGKILCQKTT